ARRRQRRDAAEVQSRRQGSHPRTHPARHSCPARRSGLQGQPHPPVHVHAHEPQGGRTTRRTDPRHQAGRSPAQHPPPPASKGMVPGSPRQPRQGRTRRDRPPQDHHRGTSPGDRKTPRRNNRRAHPVHLPPRTQVNQEGKTSPTILPDTRPPEPEHSNLYPSSFILPETPMPRPPILPTIDWKAIIASGVTYDKWLAGAENPKHREQM